MELHHNSAHQTKNSAIAIVTGNTKKYQEMTESLSHCAIPTERIEYDIDEIQHSDPEKVIADKVQKAFALAQRPVLVDDSGIYFEQYNNFPGTYSKFLFKAIGYEGIFRLVQQGDRAYFRCFVAYMDDSLREPVIFHAEQHGVLSDNNIPSEPTEMPYAPIFIPDGQEKYMSQMTPQERSHDHRHKALAAFADWFNSRKNR